PLSLVTTMPRPRTVPVVADATAYPAHEVAMTAMTTPMMPRRRSLRPPRTQTPPMTRTPPADVPAPHDGARDRTTEVRSRAPTPTRRIRTGSPTAGNPTTADPKTRTRMTATMTTTATVAPADAVAAAP